MNKTSSYNGCKASFGNLYPQYSLPKISKPRQNVSTSKTQAQFSGFLREVTSIDKNMMDSLGRAYYLPHALELDPSLERTINPNLLSLDINVLSRLDNAYFLSDALESDFNTERS